MFMHRLTHYALLTALMSVLTLPNLGAHSLWDVDEGVNAEASREMLVKGTWIVPHFNFDVRTAKPVMVNWLQMTSYSILGVNEFAARLPSVITALITVLLVYELARRMFNSMTGLLAGVVLASALEFCTLSHAATPDSPLLMFTMLTFFFFWTGSIDGGRTWFIPCGIGAGLAVLTKGPVGLVMPASVIFLYSAWNNEIRKLFDRRMVWALLAFLLIATPWYVLITLDSHGAWLKTFIGKENVGRFMQPMENHKGPFFYHFLAILVLFAPWSIFIGATLWYAAKEARQSNTETLQVELQGRACRFLLCWLMTYLVFFSIAATKLPNYVLPVYPALAILTARLLDRWLRGELTIRNGILQFALAGLVLLGLLTGVGLAITSGLMSIPGLKVRLFPEMARWVWLGGIPIAGALIAKECLRRGRKDRFIVTVATASIVFVALVASGPVVTFDRYKAPRELVDSADVRQPHRDVRLIAFQWFEPSVVFYSRREVERVVNWETAADYLAMQHPVYLFVPDSVWTRIQQQQPDVATYRTVARHYDFLKNCDILVVTNQ